MEHKESEDVHYIEDEEPEPDEFLMIYRDGYLSGYEDGLGDGRVQGREAALFLVKQAFKDSYDTDVREIVQSLEESW